MRGSPTPIRLVRCTPAARRVGRPETASQVAVFPTAVTPAFLPPPEGAEPSTPIGFQPDPHLDYGRFFTAEGGVLIVYKDLDLRFRHTLWRIGAWSAATGAAAWLLFDRSPSYSLWLTIPCLLVMAVLNWLIVAKPVEVYRRIEIRPDGLLLEGAEMFWLRLMEAGRPEFQPDEDGNQVLCGIYGTRFIEYLTARRFDEFDRMPEVLAAHLQQAMTQLWGEDDK